MKMSEISKEKRTSIDWVSANEKKISDFHQLIWNYAETAWREYKSAKAYCNFLRQEGFETVEGTGGMPTAFLATWGEGKPVLGTYAEYDAVPSNSQKAVPYRAPRDGFHPWAPGHTDPHSGLGVAALAGVLAAKEAMVKHNLKGTLKLFGEPAEKVCGSKPVHAAKGYYDDFDAFISYHPGYSKRHNTALWDIQCGSYWSIVFTFECMDPEKWVGEELLAYPGHPHAAARCPAAIDAVCMMYTITKYTKEAMLPHTGLWSLNEFIMIAGQCTSDNEPPRISQIQYCWRSPTLLMQQQIYKVLRNNAKHVAEVTGCNLSTRWITKTRVGLTNHAMTEITYKNLELVGPPEYGEEAKKVGRQIQKNLGIEPMEEPFTEACQTLTPPQRTEAEIRKGLPSWQLNFTSDDYVEYTWHAPTVRLYTAMAELKPVSGFAYPAWTWNAMSGIRSTVDPMIFTAGKTIGATLVDLLTQPEKLKKAKTEFKERTGGGVGGSKWVAPLLPSDFKPPIDLRWPEYVTTVRGEEWWIPTPIA